MTVGGMGFIPERLLMMMMMIMGIYSRKKTLRRGDYGNMVHQYIMYMPVQGGEGGAAAMHVPIYLSQHLP